MFPKSLIKVTSYAGMAFGILCALALFIQMNEKAETPEFCKIADMVSSVGISIIEIIILFCIGRALSVQEIDKPGKGVMSVAMIASAISAISSLTEDDGIALIASLIGAILFIVIGTQLRKNSTTSNIGTAFILYPVCAIISIVVLAYLEYKQISSGSILKYTAFLFVAGWFVLLEAFEKFMLPEHNN